MCGIILSFGAKSPSYVMHKMLNAIEHRGKDFVQIDEHDNCNVGFRQLSITERGTRQPGKYKETTVYLNGEIYNYKELGYSGSECEVLAKGFYEQGPQFVKKLNGMFFIVLISRNSVYVFRDRYGIKPVYYWKNNNEIVVASEIKAILQHPDYKTSINESAENQWLAFNNVFTDETLFNKIRKVDKASAWELGGEYFNFWKWDFSHSAKMSYEDAVYNTRLLLKQSIQRQTPTEVAAGTCLSGGIDSNIIAALSGDIYTFTAGFSEGNDETALARLGAKNHREIIYNTVRYFSETIRSLEDLRVGASWSNYGLYELASKYVKVLFDGAGADELFGGYPWRYDMSKQYTNAILNRTGYECPLPECADAPDTLENRFKFDADHFLEGVLLVVDKLSMAHTIESRVPFLDNDLVDFALTIPNEWRKDKQILKDAFADVLHPDILKAKKRGFSSPDWIPGTGNQANKWANAALNEWKKIYL
jgi:asparagine synthase (glutamine-hydrolysing)